MCGIAGFCDFSKKSDKQTLINMTDILHHRGPDDSGYSFYENEFAHIGLGHRRLSILDLSAHGHQPMEFEHLEIVYNGEVYNFKEIKEELEKYNYTFYSDSDTEVILKAYHKWGIKAVDKFNGMFAIAILDKSKAKLIFIRDRAGVKPFYYYNKDNLILFSSELKSFHNHRNFSKEINIDALALFLQFGYIPEPHSIFQNTYKLKAGYYIEINLETKGVQEIKYWDVINFYNKPKLVLSENEAILETEKLMKSAFEYRMVSDVPVGVFLSGGYDSSVVTAILQNQRTEKLNTFTIGFEENGFDEAPYAKQVANYLGTNHTEYYCTQKDALDVIPKLCEIYDEPFADNSAIPTILVSQLAKKDVSVSLSADGGDEIFAGYNKYQNIMKSYLISQKIPNQIKEIMNHNISCSILGKVATILNISNASMRIKKLNELFKTNDIPKVLEVVGKYFQNDEVISLLNKNTFEIKTNFDTTLDSHLTNLDQLLAIDYKTYMVDDVLTKIDRATMSVSLEGREPLLDYRIIEFVGQLPDEMKINRNEKKYLLKKITHKYLPSKMMNRPKKGFDIPIQSWLKDELIDLLETHINEFELSEHNIFNMQVVLLLKKDFLSNNHETNANKLWHILIFQMWYQKWMKD